MSPEEYMKLKKQRSTPSNKQAAAAVPIPPPDPFSSERDRRGAVELLRRHAENVKNVERSLIEYVQTIQEMERFYKGPAKRNPSTFAAYLHGHLRTASALLAGVKKLKTLEKLSGDSGWKLGVPLVDSSQPTAPAVTVRKSPQKPRKFDDLKVLGLGGGAE